MPQVDKFQMIRYLTEIEMCAHDARQALCHADHFGEVAATPMILRPGQGGNGQNPNQQAGQMAQASIQGMRNAISRMFAYAARLEAAMKGEAAEPEQEPVT